jgi:hypothetical protein
MSEKPTLAHATDLLARGWTRWRLSGVGNVLTVRILELGVFCSDVQDSGRRGGRASSLAL